MWFCYGPFFSPFRFYDTEKVPQRDSMNGSEVVMFLSPIFLGSILLFATRHVFIIPFSQFLIDTASRFEISPISVIIAMYWLGGTIPGFLVFFLEAKRRKLKKELLELMRQKCSEICPS